MNRQDVRMCKLHEQTSCCFSRKRFDIFCFQGADTLEKIVSFNKQLRQFKKVHERFVLDSKDLGFSEFLVNMRIIVFFSNKLDARVLLMNKTFFQEQASDGRESEGGQHGGGELHS